MKLAAFDIGGTTLKMGVVTAEGEIISQDKTDIDDSNGSQVLQEMTQWLKKNNEAEGIAISVPGHVDPRSGYIAMGGAIREFDDFHLGEWLEKHTALPFSIENDANCALLAERWLGKAQDMSDFLMMTIGTGIGGAVYCNNALVHGKNFHAGEFGCLLNTRPGSNRLVHYTMNQTCTMSVLVENYHRHTGRTMKEITGKEIFTKYDEGEAICTRLVTTFYQDLCAGIYNLSHIFDPECIFLGGGITGRESFLDEIHFHLEWFNVEAKVDTATYGNDSGMLGAVYHFLQTHK